MKEKEANDWNGQKLYTKKKKKKERKKKVGILITKGKKDESFPSKSEMNHTLSTYKAPPLYVCLYWLPQLGWYNHIG